MADKKKKVEKEPKHYLETAIDLIETCEGCDGFIDFVSVDLNDKGAAEKIQALYNLGYKGYRHFCTDEVSIYVFKLSN